MGSDSDSSLMDSDSFIWRASSVAIGESLGSQRAQSQFPQCRGVQEEFLPQNLHYFFYCTFIWRSSMMNLRSLASDLRSTLVFVEFTFHSNELTS
jgi:hypothetical protein